MLVTDSFMMESNIPIRDMNSEPAHLPGVVMHRARTITALAASAAALVMSGCEPKLFRAETVLNDDGSVRRAIYQPADATTAEAQKPGVWTGNTYAQRIEPDAWSGKIADFPAAAHDDKHPYFAGWGDFESPDRLPSAFVKQAPPGLPDGKLVVEYQRDDYVLVVQHRWKETLTDIVTIDDMHLARREMADLLIPLAQKILDKALGDEYDTTHLVDWLHQTARPWFFEITDIVVASGARRELLEDKLDLALAPVCARHGLVLTDASGKPLDDEKIERAVGLYAERVLRDNLRRRDGEPVSDEAIHEILEWLGFRERLENSDERYKRYNDAVETVIAETFGGDEAFEDAVKPLWARLLGLYVSDFVGSPHHFHYTLTTPGAIVKTNGTLVSDRSVRWTFAGGEAYPFGYAMECESLDVQSELEQELLGEKVLDNRDTMLKYVEIVGSNEALLDALRACAREKSMAPFYKARDQSAAASKTEEAFDAMFRLLKLPDEPAKR